MDDGIIAMTRGIKRWNPGGSTDVRADVRGGIGGRDAPQKVKFSGMNASVMGDEGVNEEVNVKGSGVAKAMSAVDGLFGGGGGPGQGGEENMMSGGEINGNASAFDGAEGNCAGGGIKGGGNGKFVGFMAGDGEGGTKGLNCFEKGVKNGMKGAEDDKRIERVVVKKGNDFSKFVGAGFRGLLKAGESSEVMIGEVGEGGSWKVMMEDGEGG